MDNVDECEEDEHDHHVEGSSISCNDNFLTTAQVSNSIECRRKKKSKTNKCQFS